MKKTINRVLGLMLAVSLPMAGLTIAANTDKTSTAPASIQMDIAVATPTSTPAPTYGDTKATESPKTFVGTRPGRIGGAATPYPSMVYNETNGTYSTPDIGNTGLYSTVQRYSGLGTWWSSLYTSIIDTNTSMIDVSNSDPSSIYVGPWSRDVIASDYIITLR